MALTAHVAENQFIWHQSEGGPWSMKDMKAWYPSIVEC